MQPDQFAVVWMLYDQTQRSEAASRRVQPAARPSFANSFAGRLRRIAYRAQLGPVTGSSAA
jgi:hypothetical protein